MKPNIGKIKQFVKLEYDDEGNEFEKLYAEDEQGQQDAESSKNSELSEDENEDSEDEMPLGDLINKVKQSTRLQEKLKEKQSIHSQVLSNLRENADKAAEKMEKKHNNKRNKKTVVYQVGDSVSVKIPSIDHGGTELRRIPCVVIDLVHEKYRLVCPYGILNELFSANELEIYNGLIDRSQNECECWIMIGHARLCLYYRSSGFLEI